MKQFKSAVLLVSLLLSLSGRGIARAATPLPQLLITEAQTGTTVSASEEFIEIANTTVDAIDVSSVKIEYFSAASSSFDKPSRTVTLHGLLTPGDHYLVASTGYSPAELINDTFSSGLAANGGHLRLINSATKEVYDVLGWGSAVHPESKAASPAKTGHTLQRRIVAGKLIDTNDNQADFESATPTPTGYTPPPSEPEQEPDLDPTVPDTPLPETPEPAPDDTPTPTTPVVVQITELLPNPASPQTDASDEYIELYNPNDQLIDLRGYKLQTGNTYNHSFTFTEASLPPFSYQVFYSSETKASLANSGGKARLLAPTGEVVSETEAYGSAADGRTWAWDGTRWQWTITASPAAGNIITTPAVATKVAKTTAAKTTSKKVKTSSTKTTKPKVTKAKAVKGAKTTTPVLASGTPDNKGIGVQPWLLAGAGGLAVLYGAYEYRSDLANSLRKLRFYRKNSREAGKES